MSKLPSLDRELDKYREIDESDDTNLKIDKAFTRGMEEDPPGEFEVKNIGISSSFDTKNEETTLNVEIDISLEKGSTLKNFSIDIETSRVGLLDSFDADNVPGMVNSLLEGASISEDIVDNLVDPVSVWYEFDKNGVSIRISTVEISDGDISVDSSSLVFDGGNTLTWSGDNTAWEVSDDFNTTDNTITSDTSYYAGDNSEQITDNNSIQDNSIWSSEKLDDEEDRSTR